MRLPREPREKIRAPFSARDSEENASCEEFGFDRSDALYSAPAIVPFRRMVLEMGLFLKADLKMWGNESRTPLELRKFASIPLPRQAL